MKKSRVIQHLTFTFVIQHLTFTWNQLGKPCTLPVPGAYSLLNLDKRQLCWAGEILDEILCFQVLDKIRHWNLEGPLNRGWIQLDGGSIGQV